MLVAGDPPEVLLRLTERRRRPPHCHLSVAPAADAPRVLANARVGRVDDVRRRQAPAQCRRQSEAIDGEQLSQAFPQAGRRRRPFPLQPTPRTAPPCGYPRRPPASTPRAASTAPVRAAPSADGPVRSAPCDSYSAGPGSACRTRGRWRCAVPWRRRSRTAGAGPPAARARPTPRAGPS